MNCSKKIHSVWALGLALFFAGLLLYACSGSTKDTALKKQGVIMDIPGYPFVFELNKGDSMLIDRTFNNKRIVRILTLRDVRLFQENTVWFPDSLGRWNYYKAEIDIIISGKVYTLYFRPYQMPETIDGLRLYVEGIKSMGYDRSLNEDVRFSVCLENEPWGLPSELEFPVNDYRFRSSTYFNTWSALVPFNVKTRKYYHMGEDLGAIPDKLEVCSWSDGVVLRSPIPKGDNSNTILIRQNNGIEFGYYHCNLGSIDTAIKAGRMVKKGQIIAKTGSTWTGEPGSQYWDPHLHTGIRFNRYNISVYPHLIEAYFRKYEDKVLAIAGGFRYGFTGDSIELDASRSVCRDKEKIKSYQWRLHDGSIVNKAVVKVKYNNPGYYSEELIVETEGGDIDKDFLQVRINNIDSPGDYAWGWAYYSPVRNIKPGQNILFWNRVNNSENDVLIDFGDGSTVQKIGRELYHSYSKSGNYTVKLTSMDVNDDPVSVKLEVIVE